MDLYPQLSGIQVIEVLTDEGKEVKKGDVLACLDPAEIQLELEQAEANHNEVEQRLFKAEVSVKEAKERTRNALLAEEKARIDYEKSQAMSASELISEDELATDKLAWEQAASELDLARLADQQAELDLKLGANDVEKNRIAVETSRLKLSRTKIIAPFDGFITFRGATPGMTISASTLLFTLVNRDELVANLRVPQDELLALEIGQPVVFACDALPARSSGAESRSSTPWWTPRAEPSS